MDQLGKEDLLDRRIALLRELFLHPRLVLASKGQPIGNQMPVAHQRKERALVVGIAHADGQGSVCLHDGGLDVFEAGHSLLAHTPAEPLRGQTNLRAARNVHPTIANDELGLRGGQALEAL